MENLKYLDKNHNHPIEIKIATKEDRAEWQKEVMPFEKSETAKNWNWEKDTSEIGHAYSISKILGQEPEFIILKKEKIPIAIMLYVKNYYEYATTANKKDTAIIWYVQKAPKEYLIKCGINEKEFDIKISKAILDVSLTSSLKESGNLLLHADPKGGNKLLEFYKQEGFRQLPKEQGRISASRGNDGRYFYMNRDMILSIVKNNRETIGQSIKIPDKEKSKNNNIDQQTSATKNPLIEKVKSFCKARDAKQIKSQEKANDKGVEK